MWHRESEIIHLNTFALSESIVDEIIEKMWNGVVLENKVVLKKNVQSEENSKKRKLSEEEERE